MRTLIHHDGALGDTLLSLPCFKLLREGSDSLHFIGRRDVAGFLMEAGVADESHPSDLAFLASLCTSPEPTLQIFLQRFERAYVFSSLPDPPTAYGIRRFIPATRIVKTVPPQGNRMHTGRFRFAQIAPEDAEVSDYSALPAIPEMHRSIALSFLFQKGCPAGKSLIAVHPGSGGRSKCWPLERYFELIENLESRCNFFTLIFSGPDESEDIKKRISAFAAGRPYRLHASGLKLISAAALLSLCDLSIGNDSGFSHLAAAAGCPSLVLFGPSDPRLWSPIGRVVEIINAGSGIIAEIRVSDALARTEQLVAALHSPALPSRGISAPSF